MGDSFGRTMGSRTPGADTPDGTDGTGPAPATDIPAAETPATDIPVAGIPAQRSAPTRTEVPATGVHHCRCGHDADAHEHFRAGSECAACDCAAYRTTSGLAALLAATTRRGR